jgi:hypothetical protein
VRAAYVSHANPVERAIRTGSYPAERSRDAGIDQIRIGMIT